MIDEALIGEKEKAELLSTVLDEVKPQTPAKIEEKSAWLSSIDQSTSDVVASMMKAENQEELNGLLAAFNLNQNKKTILRILQYNDLFDKVTEEALRRYEKHPDEISNKELLDCITVVSNQLDRSQRILQGVADTPNIQVHQQTNEININVGKTNELTQDEKQNVISAINQILALAKQPTPTVVEEPENKEESTTNMDTTTVPPIIDTTGDE